MQESPLAASVHRTVGRYEILRELGRGMMGVVYEARDPSLGRTIALKTIRAAPGASRAEREAFERRFAAEARIAAQLSHPGIVVVHDVGRDEATGLLFIALERLPGETLASLMGRGVRLSWKEGLEVVRRVAEALQHAHEHGVIHRDIKPANIMLLPSGQPKVMDFGLAKVESAHLTAAGQFFGTPLYMAPEQVLSQNVDARSDIFSLGSVAYALLTGRQAFEGESVARILARVVHQDPLPPTRLDPGLPADVDDLIARALAKSPDRRYRDAGALAEDSQDVLAGVAPRHRSGWTPPPPTLPPDREPTLIAELGPAAFMPTITVAPSAGVEGAPPLPPPLAAGRRGVGRLLPPRTLALLAALVVALAGLVWSRVPHRPVALPPAVPPPTAAPAPSSPTPEPTPEATPVPVPPPARVVVDFQHPLESGRLRVWLDGEELLVERVRGEVTKNLVLFKLRGGVLTEVLDIGPGRHRFRVEVSWNGERRSAGLPGRFAAGQTYRLEVRLSRLTKELSLRWTG
ncbi:MAG TPA: serine/threonine-protein kinase [Vicinamibacteria bacterium]|nr:serine/threonine-protein kinase [Vicinamibacteria bacterium]